MKRASRLAAVGSFIGLFLFSPCYGAGDKPKTEHPDIRKAAFNRMQTILEKKKVQVLKYCDGKILVMPLERCVRIRTGEEGDDAIG